MSEIEKITFDDRGTILTGLLARPAGRPRAAIVVFPTIANVTPGIEHRAQMLADQGYVAMIADFYGEQPASFEAARPLATALRGDVDHYRARLAANVTSLRRHEAAKGLPIAAVGYCMGGQAVLELARAGETLALAASFHGTLETGRPADTAIIPRVLVCHGDADPMVPREHVLALWQELDSVGANWHFHSYSGVKHGFTDPASDARGMAAVAYSASADRQSWAALLAMMDEVFE